MIVDTADYEQIPALPLVGEATTNPSIVWGAAQQDKYFHLLEEACDVRKASALTSILILSSSSASPTHPAVPFHKHKMYRPTLGKDGVMDMLEAVPVKFARELFRRLPPQERKVYFQVGTHTDTRVCVYDGCD